MIYDKVFAMTKKLLEVGDKAPDFILKNQNGDHISLSDYAGKKNVVLYFYPAALTPGCTVQACGIRDAKQEIEDTGTVVLGVSPDTVEKVKTFENKYHLNFDLLTDTNHKVAEAYGVWGEKSMFGKLVQGLKRITYIIGKDGKIKHVMPKVDTKTHHDDVLKILKSL